MDQQVREGENKEKVFAILQESTFTQACWVKPAEAALEGGLGLGSCSISVAVYFNVKEICRAGPFTTR